MNKNTYRAIVLAITLASAGGLNAAVLLTNGGFESGLTGWTTEDAPGSEGSFTSQSGVTSPVSGFPVPAPPQGTSAAMTDALGPGSHVLYQDFIVPLSVINASIHFSLFINNAADAFTIPASLEFSTPALNQQARVDIITTGADPFSVAVGDVLQNLYQTQIGHPLVSGYSSSTVDLTALLQAQLGQTLRLRFAEVDNVNAFNLGVDDAAIVTDVTSGVPEPSTWVTGGASLAALALIRLKRNRQGCRQA